MPGEGPMPNPPTPSGSHGVLEQSLFSSSLSLPQSDSEGPPTHGGETEGGIGRGAGVGGG